jgi:hypothetical protein
MGGRFATIASKARIMNLMLAARASVLTGFAADFLRDSL